MEPEMLNYYNSLQKEAKWIHNWGDRSSCYFKHQTSCKSTGWSFARQISCLVLTKTYPQNTYMWENVLIFLTDVIKDLEEHLPKKTGREGAPDADYICLS